jgi:plastocyanin
MRAPVTTGALALLGLAAGAGPAAAAPANVGIQFAAFAPSQIDVLPGDTVQWSNASARAHTVTSESGAFGSGELASGERFDWTAGPAGTYAYRCTIHPGMTGEIDVRRVTLGPVATTVVTPGTRFELTGRTADPWQPVRIERGGPAGFATVATAMPSPSGDWRATVRVGETGDYRAASSTGVSETRRIRVSRRRVLLRATRTGVHVTVRPSDPYGRIVLESRLRERFGWWPIAFRRLDYVSTAGFRVRGRARLRAVLVDTDGWTPLATSPVVVLKRSGR